MSKQHDPYMYKPALYYYACCKSEHVSFVELFNDLEKYVDNPKRRFKICVRAKRGLEDTSKSGGLYKDKAYFEGAVKILQKRKELDLELLYAGKISVDDLLKTEIQKSIIRDGIKLPYFIKERETYLKALEKIAQTNFLE